MPLEHLEGIVERITFYNAENGYSVVRVRPNKLRRGQLGKDGLATVLGNPAGTSAGGIGALQRGLDDA